MHDETEELPPLGAERAWFIRDWIGGMPPQPWRFDQKTATKWNVSNAEGGVGTHFEALDNETIWDALRRQTGWLDPAQTGGHFHRMVLRPGEYFPRMARPHAFATQPLLYAPPLDAERAYIANSRSQLTILLRRLETICQTIQPSEKNLEAYGHEIRNLLILASTEVEMHWRGIIFANGETESRLSSRAYSRLIEPLRLAEYVVAFRDYPDLVPIRPFEGWSKADPTASLPWYDAYNGAKHNRELEFERATLRATFAAVSGCLSLVVAQFGPTALSAELAQMVTIETPTWPMKDRYMGLIDGPEWIAVPHPDLRSGR